LDESESQLRGLCREAGMRAYVNFRMEQLWIRAVICRYERYAYRNADRVLVNYRSVQGLVCNRFGQDVKCQIIPYSIEQEFLDNPRPAAIKLERERPVPLIVSVARHDPRKGVDSLLRALHVLKQSGVSFSAKLIGGGVLFNAHRRLLHSLQLSDRVELLGYVASIDPYLARADVFVLPSREEQSGSLALIEALRAGVACVASACDGIPEDVRHAVDAWLTTPGDPKSLAAGINALISNPNLRASLARSGRQVFEEKFSGIAFAASLDRVYRDVLSATTKQS
jgi:glycosyltransferase involved in cell wall biosynthesis